MGTTKTDQTNLLLPESDSGINPFRIHEDVEQVQVPSPG